MATNNSVNTSLSGQTGTGNFVGATSPTLITPVLGVASATSVNFGGTALSTYVQNTFTPTITGSSANPGSITYSSQVGKYSQIGNVVFFSANIVVSALTIGAASGNLQLSGLPVTSVNTSGLNNQCVITYANLNLAALTTTVTGFINPSSTVIDFFESFNNGANVIIPVTAITSTTNLYVSGFYFAS